MIKALYLATLSDRNWWAGMLQLALGIYIALMGLIVTVVVLGSAYDFFRD